MISKSLPAANRVFPSVLKLTSAPSIQVKTLVYLVTLRLAPSEPDVALLSINSFQRDLSDAAPIIRGMALRVLSGLGVKMAAPIMEMAIAKSIRDPSFYVRRIAADAVGKCCELSSSMLPSLLPHLSTLLADRHPSVLGSALLAFNCIAADRYDLLHPHYRRICHALVDIDEWNQPTSLRALAGYARRNIRRPSQTEASVVDDGKGEKKVTGRTRWGSNIDADLELLLAKAEPLLHSRNAATTLATCHLFVSLLPLESPVHVILVQPLLRLLRGHPTQAWIALLFIRKLNHLRPELFVDHVRAFLPMGAISGEPAYMTTLKLDVLVDLAVRKPAGSTSDLVLSELEEAAMHRPEQEVVSRAVQGLGRLASLDGAMDRCTEILLTVLKDRSSVQGQQAAVGAAMSVLKQIVETRTKAADASSSSSSQGVSYVLYRLSSLLFKADKAGESSKSTSLLGKHSLSDGVGRASIYWLLGQYCRLQLKIISKGSSGETSKTLAETILPELLRKAASNFGQEATPAKLAILTLSAKLQAFLPSTEAEAATIQAVAALHAYLLQLARFDLNYDVRDRSRYYSRLLSALGESSQVTRSSDDEEEQEVSSSGIRLRRDQVLVVLFDGKTESTRQPELIDRTDGISATLDPLVLTSSSRTVPKGTIGLLPPWQEDSTKIPPASIRDPSDPSISSVPVTMTTKVSASANIRSISSDSFKGGSSASSRVVLTPTNRSGSSTPISGAGAAAVEAGVRQGKGKYRDLDDFLDAESEDEEEESSSGGSSAEQSEDENSSDQEEEDEDSEAEADSTTSGSSDVSSEDDEPLQSSTTSGLR